MTIRGGLFPEIVADVLYQSVQYAGRGRSNLTHSFRDDDGLNPTNTAVHHALEAIQSLIRTLMDVMETM